MSKAIDVGCPQRSMSLRPLQIQVSHGSTGIHPGRPYGLAMLEQMTYFVVKG